MIFLNLTRELLLFHKLLLNESPALCTLDSNIIIWLYLECGPGVFNKETSSNILMFGFYGKEVLTHIFYDEIY